MSEFKREARYIVIKTSDLAKVPAAYRSDLVDPLSRLQDHLPSRDFVVVESDWPEYEPVWQMIEARVNGEPNALDAALAREADLRDELDMIRKAVPNSTRELVSLQQRLTDAEKRADIMDNLLLAARPMIPRGKFGSKNYQWHLEVREALKPADGGYLKSCEVAHRALSMENQRITPARFNCLACGDMHEGSGNLPCLKMTPYSGIKP